MARRHYDITCLKCQPYVELSLFCLRKTLVTSLFFFLVYCEPHFKHFGNFERPNENPVYHYFDNFLVLFFFCLKTCCVPLCFCYINVFFCVITLVASCSIVQYNMHSPMCVRTLCSLHLVSGCNFYGISLLDEQILG